MWEIHLSNSSKRLVTSGCIIVFGGSSHPRDACDRTLPGLMQVLICFPPNLYVVICYSVAEGDSTCKY